MSKIDQCIRKNTSWKVAERVGRLPRSAPKNSRDNDQNSNIGIFTVPLRPVAAARRSHELEHRLKMSTPIPRMFAVRQKFPPSSPLDIPAVVQREFRTQKVL